MLYADDLTVPSKSAEGLVLQCLLRWGEVEDHNKGEGMCLHVSERMNNFTEQLYSVILKEERKVC